MVSSDVATRIPATRLKAMKGASTARARPAVAHPTSKATPVDTPATTYERNVKNKFISIILSQSQSKENSEFSTNVQSKFALAVIDGVLGPSHPVRHTWQRPWFSAIMVETHEAIWVALKGTVSAQKSLQVTEVGTRELLVGTEEKYLPKPWFAWFFLPI